MYVDIKRLEIPDVIVLEPQSFVDERGYFFEAFNQQHFEKVIDRKIDFIQDNQSRSVKNVLRGLHYQIDKAQAKLVRVLYGEILDVAVDLRKTSPTFGMYVWSIISSENKKQVWIPEGFAHGFLVTSDYADVFYKVNNEYSVEAERCLKWDDSNINIDWNLSESPIVSAKDLLGKTLEFADYFD